MTKNKLIWHAAPAREVLEALHTGPGGLAAAEAARRLERYGPNALPPPARRGPLLRFLLQFHNVLIYVLLGAAVVTAALGQWVDTGVILGVVLINAVVGFVQEGKAERALEAIRGMLSPNAVALRDGAKRVLPAEALVPGDVVLLASGDKVPADLRLLEARSLRIDEAALTGESVPVDKGVEPVAPDEVLGDRAPMAFSGTLVTYGTGKGVVVATGAATEIGRISGLLATVTELTTPLLRKLARFSQWLTVAILALTVVTFAIGILWRGYSASEMFLAAVGLAVAAIPEGLPAIMTITLAIGVQRMARRNAIIRRLPAVETLGSVTVICTDKTGTLTRNEMAVRRALTAEADYDVEGEGYAPHGAIRSGEPPVHGHEDPLLRELALAALLCNDAQIRPAEGGWRLEGEPTEGALLAFGMKARLEPGAEGKRRPRHDVIPFESQHRFMATLHGGEPGAMIYAKGAPERILAMCQTERTSADERPLDRARWTARIEDLAESGLRLIALAARAAEPGQRQLEMSHAEGGFALLGVLGIIDPPREEAIAAVRQCREAGIRVKMITGDHAVTARAIAATLGIGDGRSALAGPEIERASDAELERIAPAIDVFARASPEHKLRLVQALQKRGEIVAMTGAGVNDAPALKRADVGVAMGRKGTEAAKEAAEMVLADDNFASIAHAVEEGRTVYDNLRKAIVFIMPTNGGEAGALLAAIAFGLTLPITPVQILWVNMVTAVTLSLALAFERAEPRVMARPPREPEEPILSGFVLWRIVMVSLVLVAGVVGLFEWMLERGAGIEAARTVAVNTLVIGEIVYLFNSRHLVDSVLSREGLLGNAIALYAVGVLALLQAALTYVPAMQRLFGTAPLDGFGWAAVAAFGVTLFLLVEAEKLIVRRLVPRAA